MKDLLITNIGRLHQVRDHQSGFLSGTQMMEWPCIDHAWLRIRSGKIESFGLMAELLPETGPVLDAEGGWVFPGWCDSHTHIVFAASREQEFVDRINGLTYEQIAANGGGILNSAAKMATASEDELFESAQQRLQEIIQRGTVAVEIKSGYGLSLESELKMLKVIKRLKESSPIDIKTTFLGAHAIPLQYKQNREEYIRVIIEEMLPEVASQNLADYCDVFCDRGFFTPEETILILNAASNYGMKAKIHANELGVTGGVQAGVACNALSVDHLESMDQAAIDALKGTNTMPTLLPGTAFFLGMEFAPARQMIDEGLPVALASDYNPGSTPSGNMSFVVSLACIKMKMLPEEAMNAATINGAYAMELESQYGSIQKGKWGSVFITPALTSLAYIPYAFGSDLIHSVIVKGELTVKKQYNI
ncbi:MAG: imidazolonepropionase [Saprospiraceae bacterium]|nr:imidazolonepropionase [Saprospiraceae bacterium]